MKLIIIGSSSQGNSYALQADSGEFLLLEAGVSLKEVKRNIGYKTSKVVGCIVSHIHGDHSKYANEYLKAGMQVLSNEDVAEKIPGVEAIHEETTLQLGKFRVTPFNVEHDVKNYGYLIYHPSYGSIFFATDCYNLHFALKGCKTYLAECNYSDKLLKMKVSEGVTPKYQADRVMLSHMSMEHCVSWLHDCKAEETAGQIVLIHGSARHLNPQEATSEVQQEFGIPVFYAKKGLMINLM